MIMSKVKIETLTPVHIGCGNTLQKGLDYVVVDDNLYVIDQKKVLDIIGTHKIDAWVSSIEKGEDIAGFISRQGVKTHPKEYSTRNMWCGKGYATVKECIHDGRGLPYIPGSSIKGAIRTAVLATEIEGNENDYIEYLQKKKEEVDNRRCKKDKVSNGIEEKLFSKPAPEGKKSISAPNTSYMRFLQLGDAYFNEECETVLNAINLNIRERDSLIDKSKPQAIEAIKYGKKTELEIRLKKDIIKNDREGFIHKLPECMNSLENLFITINNHTKKLLEEELKYWSDVAKELSGADSYIEFIEDLIVKTEDAISGKECILRVGHASGWRFITGAWTEKLVDFKNTIVPMARPGNFKYTNYDFPKSRRVYEIEGEAEDDMEVDVLGFVKLTLI